MSYFVDGVGWTTTPYLYRDDYDDYDYRKRKGLLTSEEQWELDEYEYDRMHQESLPPLFTIEKEIDEDELFLTFRVCMEEWCNE